MINQKLFDYIKACPTPYHTVAHTEKILSEQGYTLLSESSAWDLREGGKYYVCRGGSSIIAFRIPKRDFCGFMLSAAHSDSPAFKIKENDTLGDSGYLRLSCERYGGMIMSSWMDRPLSIAGRVLVDTPHGVESRLVDFAEPLAIIPNVAIHLTRSEGKREENAAIDLVPLYSGADFGVRLRERVAKTLKTDEKSILSSDLFLYNCEQGREFNDLICAPRLDDLQCAFASLEAFISAKDGQSVPVYCLFDNEEVGSATKQGAASTFLPDVLLSVCECLGLTKKQYTEKISNSFLVSCDNAHAVHPNHPELADANHRVYPNRGIVIKYNANQKYATDGVSAAIFKKLCRECGVGFQPYANRADMPGGSTLGNILSAGVSLCAVDVGLAQFAMHSCLESAGRSDTAAMIDALVVLFSSSVVKNSDGSYNITA